MIKGGWKKKKEAKKKQCLEKEGPWMFKKREDRKQFYRYTSEEKTISWLVSKVTLC